MYSSAGERQVPLADVLHRLAAGADLELHQSDVRVGFVEGVGDAAQVVDLGTAASASRIICHCTALEPRTSRLAVDDAP